MGPEMEIGETSSRHKVGLISKVESCIEELHIAQSFTNGARGLSGAMLETE